MPEPVNLSYAIGLPPEDAINYFRQKGYTFSWNWHDVWQDAHAKSFTVAKAMKLDLLQDIRGAVDKALANGTTLATFREELEPLLKKKGWWGKDEATGAQLGSAHRLETIFRTNIQSAFSAGHYKQQMESADTHPYWQYNALLDSRTRPAHSALNGKVFRFDDPFWNTMYPPNGYNCRCSVRTLTEKQVKDRGLKVETGADNIVWEDKRINKETTRPVSGYKDPKTGKVTFTDPGWSSNPGKEWARWDAKGHLPDCSEMSFADGDKQCVKMLMGQKTWKDYGRPDLRLVSDTLKIESPKILKGAETVEGAYQTIIGALGLDKVGLKEIKTPIDKVILKPELLYHVVEKRTDMRERYANFIIPTLENPFEIYLTDYGTEIRPRYIGLFTGKDSIMVVVRLNKDGSIIWNVMQSAIKGMNRNRVGNLIYSR